MSGRRISAILFGICLLAGTTGATVQIHVHLHHHHSPLHESTCPVCESIATASTAITVPPPAMVTAEAVRQSLLPISAQQPTHPDHRQPAEPRAPPNA
jgi:hypothetical protein